MTDFFLTDGHKGGQEGEKSERDEGIYTGGINRHKINKWKIGIYSDAKLTQIIAFAAGDRTKSAGYTIKLVLDYFFQVVLQTCSPEDQIKNNIRLNVIRPN